MYPKSTLSGFNSNNPSQSIAAFLQLRRVSSARMPALACLVLLVFCSSWTSAQRVHGVSVGKGHTLRRALRQTDAHTQKAEIDSRSGMLDLASQILAGEQKSEG